MVIYIYQIIPCSAQKSDTSFNIFGGLFLSRVHLGPIPKSNFMLLLMIVYFESAQKSSALKADSLKSLSATLSFGLTVFMVLLPC